MLKLKKQLIQNIIHDYTENTFIILLLEISNIKSPLDLNTLNKEQTINFITEHFDDDLIMITDKNTKIVGWEFKDALETTT